MNDLRITGTSNLLPGNGAWKGLGEDFLLDFGDYGDWPNVLLGKAQQATAWVVFLEDIVSPNKLIGQNGRQLDEILRVNLQPLMTHLEHANDVTLVAFSAYRPDSVIERARSVSPWRELSDKFRQALYSLVERFQSLHLIALDEVFAEQGVARCFDARNFYASSCRLSPLGLQLVAEAAGKVLSRTRYPAKKVLVLDCDNTIWGGVVGEVGLAGLALGGDGMGRLFADFQRSAKRWEAQGVMLAISSKNDERDVWEVFDRHPEMQIAKNDLVGWRINWREKSENLAELADQLSLGLDSFVFWDDNPLEREKMRHRLPQIDTPEPPMDVSSWPAMLDAYDGFAKISTTEDDLKKTQQYRQRSVFISALADVQDETAFLKSLALKPVTLTLGEETIARAQQMCQKTNQFNLRTERYTAPDLKAMSTDRNVVALLVKLSDKFGDHGIVGLAIARISGETAFLDTFLMSCRILGRHLEAWFLQELVDHLKRRECHFLLAEYRSNERNEMSATFLPDHGLRPADSWDASDRSRWLAHKDEFGIKGQQFAASLDTLSVPFAEIYDV